MTKFHQIFVLLEKVPRDSKNEFELAMVNEPSVFELSRFYCIYMNMMNDNFSVFFSLS